VEWSLRSIVRNDKAMGYERMETLHNVVQLSPYSFSHLIFSSSQFMGQNTICVAAD